MKKIILIFILFSQNLSALKCSLHDEDAKRLAAIAIKINKSTKHKRQKLIQYYSQSLGVTPEVLIKTLVLLSEMDDDEPTGLLYLNDANNYTKEALSFIWENRLFFGVVALAYFAYHTSSNINTARNSPALKNASRQLDLVSRRQDSIEEILIPLCERQHRELIRSLEVELALPKHDEITKQSINALVAYLKHISDDGNTDTGNLQIDTMIERLQNLPIQQWE